MTAALHQPGDSQADDLVLPAGDVGPQPGAAARQRGPQLLNDDVEVALERADEQQHGVQVGRLGLAHLQFADGHP